MYKETEALLKLIAQQDSEKAIRLLRQLAPDDLIDMAELSTDPMALELMGSHLCPLVRLGVAKNQHADPVTLTRLTMDTDPTIRAFAHCGLTRNR